MLRGRVNRSQELPWHLGHNRGAEIASSGSNPHNRHCNLNMATGAESAAAKRSYLKKLPSDANGSMLMDIVNLHLSAT